FRLRQARSRRRGFIRHRHEEGARGSLGASTGMIISVKGTKEQDRQTDPAQRYELKNQERKPRTPYAIGLLLMGIALYPKSIMPLFPRQEEGSAAALLEPEGKPEPQIS